MSNYIGTQDYFNNLSVEISGILIELILLSLLVPIIIWIYNFRKNRFKKFHGITILYGMFNSTLDQIALLFDFDKINFEKDDILNTTDVCPVLKYYFKNSTEIKTNYLNCRFYGNLKTKLFCIEHYCNNNKAITTDNNKVSNIIEALNLTVKKFEQLKFLELNHTLEMELKVINTTIYALIEKIKENSDKNSSHDELISNIHNITFMIMHLFYKYVHFYENHFFYYELSDEIFNTDYSNQRDIMLAKFHKKETKNETKSQFWNELFMLIRIIKKKFNAS